MNHEPNLQQIQKEYHGTFRSYFIGFFGSLFLTLISFGLVISKQLTASALVYAIVALALIQGAVQLRYFLKLGYEDHPRWETIIFFFMFLILLVIAIGSLWIMHDLNDRLMSDM